MALHGSMPCSYSDGMSLMTGVGRSSELTQTTKAANIGGGRALHFATFCNKS